MFGQLKDRETIVEGLEKAPDAINMLFYRRHDGKTVSSSLKAHRVLTQSGPSKEFSLETGGSHEGNSF